MPLDLPPEIREREDTTEEHSLGELPHVPADVTLSRRRALKVLAGALLGGSLLALIPGAAWGSEAEQSVEIRVGGGPRRRRRRRRSGGGVSIRIG